MINLFRPGQAYAWHSFSLDDISTREGVWELLGDFAAQHHTKELLAFLLRTHFGLEQIWYKNAQALSSYS